MPTYLLGIDNGGTMAKAALFTPDGCEVAVASRKTEMILPVPGHTERDTEALWTATAEAIRSVLATAGVDPKDIACVATAGHGNGLYLVDKQGKPVRNGIISTDTRAQEYVAKWIRDGVDEKVLPLTMQSLWAAQPNALLAWIRDHEPDVMQRAGWVLMVKDYTRFRLCGKIQSELTDASGTSLTNVGTGQYDDEVLEAFGLAEMRDLLPPVVRSEEICGTVTAEAAAETGLAEGTPVAGGLFDVDACCLAAGLVDSSQLCLVAGTWSVNQYIATEPVVSRDIFMCCRYCIPDYYLMMEASATSASNLEWFVSQFFEGQHQSDTQKDGSIYELCNRWVAEAKPEESNIVFLPFLFGSNATPNAKASLVGLNGWHNRGHALRAIYEGVAFGHKAHTDRLMKFREPAETIRLVGGAARSEVWGQIFADVFQMPVAIPSGTELGALGCAICGSVAAGIYPNYAEAITAMVETSRVHEPNPAMADLYAQKYARYEKVLAALEPVWGDWA